MLSLKDRRSLVEVTPWSLLTKDRLDGESAYSGFTLKAFRVARGWNINQMARVLGIKKVSALRRLEKLDKIGIKRAKELAYIFKVPEYRIFRDRTKLEEYRPTAVAVKVLKEAQEELGEEITVLAGKHSVTEKGKEAIKLVIRTKKRKFPDNIKGIVLIVEKER